MDLSRALRIIEKIFIANRKEIKDSLFNKLSLQVEKTNKQYGLF